MTWNSLLEANFKTELLTAVKYVQERRLELIKFCCTVFSLMPVSV